MTTQQLLHTLLTVYREDLTQKQLDAFESMRDRHLTEKQERWVYGVAEKLGIAVAPARNVFSAMPEKKQREYVERASKVKLPWELPGYSKAAKPPGRGA